ncbi:hypothetical protein C2W62_11175 [Candidatus Entotheonella serta]|nr:hypothetical protein C2W62_11175 [Candidatus Entotheonella serta]
MDRLLTIGQLARVTGVAPKTIRYYEQAGILPVPRRSEAGYQQYVQWDVHRLLFIRRARSLGVSIRSLKVLIADLDEGRCDAVRPQLLDLVQGQLQAVRQQIAEFHLLQQQLQQVERQLMTPTSLRSDQDENCECLEAVTTAPPSHPAILGEKNMHVQQTVEALTTLPTTSGADDVSCGCGCGCPVVEPSALSMVVNPLFETAEELDVMEQSRNS